MLQTPRNALKEILQDFEKHDIQYCILRNYEFLMDPTLQVGSLDAVVAWQSMDKIHELLLKHGFIERRQQFSLAHKAYFKIVDLQKISFDIQVGGVYWNDMRYLDESIVQNRVKKEFFSVPFFVPSDNDTFVMLMVHSILGKRYFKPKYQEILAIIPIDSEYVTDKIAAILGKEKAIKLVKSARQRRLETVSIFPLIVSFLFRKPFRLLILSALAFRWLSWKKLFVPAPFISIVGPDGSGKSTMAKSLYDYLRETKRKTAIAYMGRGRGHILPFMSLSRRYKTAEKKKDMLQKDMRQQTMGNHSLKRKVLYTASSFLFTADLLLRYWLTVFPLRLRKRIVITDRYCSDIILMNNVPFWWKKVLHSLFPKPTTSVLLYNSAEVLQQRRPEESLSELQRQLDIFHKLKYDLKIETKEKESDMKKVIEFIAGKLLVEWY